MRKYLLVFAFLLNLCFGNSCTGMYSNLEPNPKSNNIRKWLTETYIPTLEGKVLYVGVQCYNKDYYLFSKNPELFETIDIDERVEKYGSPYNHYTADIMDFDPGYKYNHLCIFGVLGLHNAPSRSDIYSVDNKEKILTSLHNADNLLDSGGTLFIDMITGTNVVYRKNMKAINEAFWDEMCQQAPLNNYQVIFKMKYAEIEERILWWAVKQ